MTNTTITLFTRISLIVWAMTVVMTVILMIGGNNIFK